MRIRKVRGRQVLDSRAHPTLEVDVELDTGVIGRAIAPAGASKGRLEAWDLRDGNPSRWVGLSVFKAVSIVNTVIDRELRGVNAELEEIDGRLLNLDGTMNKGCLGGNTMIAVSMAAARALARANRLPLYRYLSHLIGIEEIAIPTPMVNIISGGLHAGGNMDFQDFMIIPLGADSFSTALEWVARVYHRVRRTLRELGHKVLLADEGGFGPDLLHKEVLDLLVSAIKESQLSPGQEVAIAIDVAASHFFNQGAYVLKSEGKTLDSKEVVEMLQDLCSRYPILSVEDACSEDDLDGWRYLTERLGDKLQLVGDDLFVTNPGRISLCAGLGIANAVLIKPNQIGTVTETIEAIKLCKERGYAYIISARSGDSEDTFIVDLAIGSGSGQIKIGSIARGERTAKYNRLLRIEERLGERTHYAGVGPFKRFIKGCEG
ncbi:MAG: phosphopyruvate hydratase [Nitrososphaerota archaeon]